MGAGFQAVDEYIDAQPETSRESLHAVRKAIRAAVPAAEESISYGIPTYRVAGTPVLYFAGWKKHYSLYPASARLVAEFREDLAPYVVQGSTLRFPLAQPVPHKLIARLAKFRVREIAARTRGQ